MADVQLEKGFTRIANELLEVLAFSTLPGLQLSIIMYVMRYTFGFNRKSHSLSLGFIAKGINSSRPRVSESLNTLIRKNIVKIISEQKGTRARVLTVNKDYDTWNVDLSGFRNNKVPFEPEKHYSSIQGNTKSPNSGNEERKNKKKNINTVNFDQIEFPQELVTIGGFNETFTDWIKYRNEIQKPLTVTILKKQLEKLVQFRLAGEDVIEIINRNI